MAFLKNLFGGDKSEASMDQIHWDRLFPEDLEVHTTFQHGLPHKPSCLAYDSVQQLLAIGSHHGKVVILGKPHLEKHFDHSGSVAVLQIIFIENKGLLVTRCSNNYLYQWDLREKHARVINTLEVKGESPCLLSWRFGSDWIYVGTEESNVYVVNLRKFQLSEYSIRQESVTDSSAPIGELVAISEQPYHKKKLLLAYMSGLCVLWNLEGRLIKRQFSLDATQSYNMLVSAVWHASGHRFAASYSNGSIAVFNADDGKLERILTSRGSPDPAYQLQWFNVDMPDSWLIFAGIYSGTPGNSGSRHLTIHSSQETQLLSFPDPIVSFICLPSCPYATATQEPSCLAVLTQEEVVIVDLLSPNLSSFSLAHVMDVNCSPVTSLQFCGNCPDELVALLSAMHSKNRHADFSTKPWPLMGGRWGDEPLDSWADLVVTGHMDGSIRFWICRSATMKLIFVIETMKYFKPVAGARSRPGLATNPVVSPPSKPASLPLVNGMPEVTIKVDEDSAAVVDEVPKEDGSGPKLRPALGVFRKGTTKIGKMVSRTKSTRLGSAGEDSQLSPTFAEPSSSLGDDEPVSLTKKLRGSMRIGRAQPTSMEYIAYESASTYSPVSSRQLVLAHTNEEDGEYFAIHKLNMDVHSQALVAANCAGHVLVFDFLSRPFKKHGNKQSLLVDFSKDTVFCIEEEMESWQSPPFVVNKWAFWEDKPSLPATRKQSIPSDVQLVHHCYCVLKRKGVPLPVVITGMQFSRDNKILAIGSEEGVAVIDISWNNCLTLMAQHLSLLYMADPKAHMDQVTQQRTHPHSSDDSAMTRSEFLHRVSLARKNSLPFQNRTSLQVLTEAVDSPSEEEGKKVTCLEFVQLVLQKGHPSKLTMWVGTGSGHVMVYTVNTVQASQVITDSRRELVPTGIILSLRSQVTGLYFLNGRGEQLITPFLRSTELPPNSQPVSKRENGLTYAIICNRNSIKSLAFPGSKEVGFNEPELSGGCLVSNGLFTCEGVPCLLNLTSAGDILIHNLPAVHHLTTIPYSPLQDSQALNTFQVSGNGHAVHFTSPSEIQRLSMMKEDHTNLPHCLPDLFIQRPDPEDPAAKRKGFSSSKLPSDRSQIFGEQVTSPVSRSERKMSKTDDPGLADIPRKQTTPPTRHKGHGAASSSHGRRRSTEEGDSVFAIARQQLDQRGEDLSKLEQVSREMAAESEDFSVLAMKIKEKYQQRR